MRQILLLAAAGISTIAAAALHFLQISGTYSAIIITLLAATGSLVGLFIIAPSVIRAIRRRAIDINILMVIAVAGAWVLGEQVEAAAVVFFFCVGEWLEDLAIAKNRSSIERLMDLTPQTVRVRDGAQITELPVEQVAQGSTVVVRAGERIALDGVVTSGSASVDESPITGESVPVLKQRGDELYAGALSVDGLLEYSSTATVEDSTLARIVALVEESQSKRTPYERFINRFAKYYTPLIVAVALIVASVPPLLSALTPLELGGIATWGYRALTLLVIACPCALVIATPVSVVAGLTRAARAGVLVKGGAFLELGAKVKAIAFDKTGTLTYGRPTVVGVQVLPEAAAALNTNNVDEVRILQLAAALEQNSTHPLARAIVEAAAKSAPAGDVAHEVVGAVEAASAVGVGKAASPSHVGDTAQVLQEKAPLVSELQEVAGRGISAKIANARITVGSPSYIAELMHVSPELRARIEAIEATAATVLVVAGANTPVALVAVKDMVRSASDALVRELSAGGMQTVMLTGDNRITARAIATEAGIDTVHAELLPHEKMERIAALKEQYGVVAMVGDGINDAPALALADVGIAMGAASSDTAIQVADVALMANNIEELPAFFRLARRVVSTIHTNIVFALTIKAAVMVLAIAGIAHMWMAIFADVGVLIIVLLYSLRLGLPVRKL